MATLIPLPRNAAQGLALLDALGLLPPELAPVQVARFVCPRCGAPICAGITALHRHCIPPNDNPASRPRPMRRRWRVPVESMRLAA